MKRSLPSTSLDAYAQAKPMISGHHAKIISSLTILGTANYQQISSHNGMEPHACARRMKELCGLGFVYCPGTKTLTKSKRWAMDYCLTGQGMPKTDNAVNEYKKGEKSSTDYSKQIIQGAKQLNLL